MRCWEADAKDWHEDPVLRFLHSPLTNWETWASHFNFTIKRNMIIFLLQILIIEVVLRINESKYIRRLRLHRFKKSCKKNLDGRFRYSPRSQLSQWWARNRTLVSESWSSVLIISTLPLLSRIKYRAFIFPHYKNTLNYLWRFFLTTADLFITLETGFVMRVFSHLCQYELFSRNRQRNLWDINRTVGWVPPLLIVYFLFKVTGSCWSFIPHFIYKLRSPGESILHVNSFPGYRRKLSNSKTLRDII